MSIPTQLYWDATNKVEELKQQLTDITSLLDSSNIEIAFLREKLDNAKDANRKDVVMKIIEICGNSIDYTKPVEDNIQFDYIRSYVDSLCGCADNTNG